MDQRRVPNQRRVQRQRLRWELTEGGVSDSPPSVAAADERLTGIGRRNLRGDRVAGVGRW
jgi:hypothetical protein